MMYTLEVNTGLAGEPPRCRGTVPGVSGGQTGSFPYSESPQSSRAKRSISHEHQKTSRLSRFPKTASLTGGVAAAQPFLISDSPKWDWFRLITSP
jgi:hypothetical protein